LGFKFPRSSDTVELETAFGKAASAGKLRSYSRGDHTHGTPSGGTLTTLLEALAGIRTPFLDWSADIQLRQNLYPQAGLNIMLGSPTAMLYRVYSSGIYANAFYCDILMSSLITNDIFMRTQSNPARSVFMQSYDTAIRTVLQAINGRADIPRAGDITLLDNRNLTMGANGYIDLGEVATLPTPTAFYHGKIIVVSRNPDTEEPSRAYICLQSGITGTYEWIQTATGSP